jgi:hypothetical protein
LLLVLLALVLFGLMLMVVLEEIAISLTHQHVLVTEAQAVLMALVVLEVVTLVMAAVMVVQVEIL